MVNAPMAYESRQTAFSKAERRNDVSFIGDARGSSGRSRSPGRRAPGQPLEGQSDTTLFDFATGRFRDTNAYHSTGDTSTPRGRLLGQRVHGSPAVEMPVGDRSHVALDEKLQGAAGHSTVSSRDGVRVRLDSLDDALALVHETRPSYERKTSGKVPLSESHLMSLVDDHYVPRSLADHVNQYSGQYGLAYKDQYEPLGLKDQPDKVQYERDRSALLRASPDPNNNSRRAPNIDNAAPIIPPIINLSSQPKYATTTHADEYNESNYINKYPKALRTPSPAYSNQPGYGTWSERYRSESPPRHTATLERSTYGSVSQSTRDSKPRGTAPTHQHSDACYRKVCQFESAEPPQSPNYSTDRSYKIHETGRTPNDLTKQVHISTDDNEVFKLSNRDLRPSGVKFTQNAVLKGPPAERNAEPPRSYHMSDSYSAYLKRNTKTPISPPFPSPPSYIKRQASAEDLGRDFKRSNLHKSASQSSLTQGRFSPVHAHTDACYKKIPAPYCDPTTIRCTSRAGNHDYLSNLERNEDGLRAPTPKQDYGSTYGSRSQGNQEHQRRNDEKIDNALELIKMTSSQYNPPDVKTNKQSYPFGRPPLSPVNNRRSKSPLPPVGADYRRTPSPVDPNPPPRHLRDYKNFDYHEDTRNTMAAFESRRMQQLDTKAATPGREYVCASCNSTINADRPGCTAMSQTFHLDCFTCVACRKRLAGGSFYAVEGKPYCEEDYLDTLDKCTVCQKPIMERILRASGKPYHPPCFKCTVCQKCLDGVPFTVDQSNDIHCVGCYHEKYAPRCAACHKPITPDEGKDESYRVVAMDQSYHIECYKCEDCGMKLSSKIEGHGCYPLDKTLLCKDCNTNRVRKLTAN